MKKLSQKAEVFQGLRNSGKSLQEAYKGAGFKDDVNGSATYKLEGNVRKYALSDPKFLKTAKHVAKSMLEIALETLTNRRGDPAIQTLCIKGAMQLIEG